MDLIVGFGYDLFLMILLLVKLTHERYIYNVSCKV